MNVNFVTRLECELCGSTSNTTLLSRTMTDPAVWGFLESYYQGRIPREQMEGAEYRITQCKSCGFVWQRDVLRPELMKVLYETWISADESLNKKRFGEASLFRLYASQSMQIVQLLNKPPAAIRVLDFGMGWGYWCRMAQAFGYQVSGFETSRDRIEFARSMGIDAIENLDTVEAENFDFINAEQVFEHIVRPSQHAHMLSRLLSPGGILRIAVPDAGPLLPGLADPGWRAAKDALHPLEHINGFTHTTVRRLGESAGLFVLPPSPRFRRRLPSALATLAGRILARKRQTGTRLLFRKHA